MNINMSTPMCTSIRMRMKTRRTAMNTSMFIHMNMTMNTVTRTPMMDKRMTTDMNMPKTTDRMITGMRTITKNLITINTNKRETMSAQTIVKTELFQKCLDFHGHLCPGLSFGYQAAMAGMDWLTERRAEDEEIVAIVETDACCSDAVQVITGCTFGKGNFIYHDYGKMAFTFISRRTGKGIRISRKHAPEPSPDNRHQELMNLVRTGQASEEDQKAFKKMHEAKSMEILDQSPDTLFDIREVKISMPPKARMEPSVLCDKCKEPTMGSKLESLDGQSLCRGCLAEKKPH